MPRTVLSPSYVTQKAIAFGAAGGDAVAVDRVQGLPVESSAEGGATATIAAGASLSATIDLDRQRLHRIAVPAGWTAAAISFQASGDGATWSDLYDGSGEVVVPATSIAAGRTVAVDAAIFFGIRYLKLRSGTGGAPVTQAAQRAIALATVAR